MFNDENADLCESRWSVFLFFFFRWKGEKKKERKEKFVLREIKGIKKKRKTKGREMIERWSSPRGHRWRSLNAFLDRERTERGKGEERNRCGYVSWSREGTIVDDDTRRDMRIETRLYIYTYIGGKCVAQGCCVFVGIAFRWHGVLYAASVA